MVFAPLTRRKHSPRRDAMSGARVSAPRLSSFIFFYPWLFFISFREINPHRVSREANGFQRTARKPSVSHPSVISAIRAIRG